MAYVAGMFFGLALLWALMALIFRVLQNVPLGSSAPEGNDALRGGSSEAQRRFTAFWIRRLWPIPVICIGLGMAAMALGGATS